MSPEDVCQPLCVEPLEARILMEVGPANLDCHLWGLAALQAAQATQAAADVGLTGVSASAADAEWRDAQADLLVLDPQGRVWVDVWLRAAPGDAKPALEALGFRAEQVSEAYRVLEGPIPVNALAAAASLEGVLSITPVYRAITRAGSVTTQGDAVHLADQLRTMDPTFDGRGVTVGVLCDSASDLSASTASGDLPAGVVRLLNIPGSDEGTAAMEIVHDLAPGADLVFRSAVMGELDFAQGIGDLVAAGAKVIVDDIILPSEPFFQDGIVAQAAAEAAARNVVYVAAAGNEGDMSYDSTFAGDSGDWHDFDPGEGLDTFQSITVPGAASFFYYPMVLSLQWDQPFYTADGVVSDFDVHVYDASGTTVIASSTTNNLATQQPLEVLRWDSGSGEAKTYNIAIRHQAGPTDVRLKYLLIGPDGTTINEYATHSPTVVGHPASASVLAVGAVPWDAPDTIEPFSSLGPATILFDPQGNRLTEPQVRPKPDLVAADGVSTTLPKFAPFVGTSAAAPHVAGITAQLLSGNPHLTRQELVEAILFSAADLGEPGPDSVFGHGRVDALAAAAIAAGMPDVTPPTVTSFSPDSPAGWDVGHLRIDFSEPLDDAVIADPASYVLIEAGPDGAFDTADDAPCELSVSVDSWGRQATLELAAPGAMLDDGRYRLSLLPALADPAGNALNAGAGHVVEFTVAPAGNITDLPGGTQMDVRPDGSAVVVYGYNPHVGDFNWPQVMVGSFDANGQAAGPYQAALCAQMASWGTYTPEVALWDSGGALVRTEYTGPAWGSPGVYEMYWQDLDATGTPSEATRIGSALVINGDGAAARADANAAGAFAVVWHRNPWWIYYNVYARIYGSGGDPVGDSFLVGTGQVQKNPVVAVSDTTVAIAYEIGDDGGGNGVAARLYDLAGNPLTDQFVVNAHVAGGQMGPEIASAADGSFAVVWSGSGPGGSGVFVRRFDSTGAAAGPEVRIAAGTASDPQIAMLAGGQSVVAWLAPDGDEQGVYAQRFAADGSPLGPPMLLSNGAAGTASAPRISLAADGGILAMWQGPGGTCSRRVSWDAPAEVLPTPLGPFVRGHTPAGLTVGPVTAITVTFDRPMAPASFDPADVQIIDRAGTAIDHLSFTTTDNVSFAFTFSAQQLSGGYTIRVGSGVSDAAGRAFDQDGDITNGEAADDVFLGTFALPATPGAFPLVEGFEGGGTSALGTHWALARTGSGVIEVSAQFAPHSGAGDLLFSQTAPGVSVKEAVAVLDLSAQAGRTDLTLDFWLNWLGWLSFYTNPNHLRLYLSGDGATWRQVGDKYGGISNSSSYLHYAFDFDEMLASAGVAMDADVYVKLEHTSDTSTAKMALDDVRISDADVSGPRVLAVSPAIPVHGPVDLFSVTFDEPIDPATFTLSDVVVRDALRNAIALDPAEPIVDSGDGRTFTIRLAAPTTLSGHYAFTIGPDVRDLAGNLMNQDDDIVVGEPNGEDDYDGGFDVIFDPTPAAVPYLQEFTGLTNLADLADCWSFQSTGAGRIRLYGSTASQAMLMDASNNMYARNDAVLSVDLLGRSGVTVSFSECNWSEGDDGVDGLYISDDAGATWYRADPLSPYSRDWQSRTVDLDAAVAAAGMTYTADFRIQFSQYGKSGWSLGGRIFDNIRVSDAPPRVVSAEPDDGAVLPEGASACVVWLSEPLNAAVLDESDFVLVGSATGEHTPTGWTYDSTAGTLTIQYPAFSIDDYSLTLRSGDGLLEDAIGNDLDGDTDGSPGGDFVLTFAVALTGDANRDGKVDIGDLLTLEQHFGEEDAVWANADFDGNGTVDHLDYLTLKGNLGRTVTPPPQAASTPPGAPEEETLANVAPDSPPRGLLADDALAGLVSALAAASQGGGMGPSPTGRSASAALSPRTRQVDILLRLGEPKGPLAAPCAPGNRQMPQLSWRPAYVAGPLLYGDAQDKLPSALLSRNVRADEHGEQPGPFTAGSLTLSVQNLLPIQSPGRLGFAGIPPWPTEFELLPRQFPRLLPRPI